MDDNVKEKLRVEKFYRDHRSGCKAIKTRIDYEKRQKRIKKWWWPMFRWFDNNILFPLKEILFILFIGLVSMIIIIPLVFLVSFAPYPLNIVFTTIIIAVAMLILNDR